MTLRQKFDPKYEPNSVSFLRSKSCYMYPGMKIQRDKVKTFWRTGNRVPGDGNEVEPHLHKNGKKRSGSTSLVSPDTRWTKMNFFQKIGSGEQYPTGVQEVLTWPGEFLFLGEYESEKTKIKTDTPNMIERSWLEVAYSTDFIFAKLQTGLTLKHTKIWKTFSANFKTKAIKLPWIVFLRQLFKIRALFSKTLYCSCTVHCSWARIPDNEVLALRMVIYNEPKRRHEGL